MINDNNNSTVVGKYIVGNKFESMIASNLSMFQPDNSYILRNINLYSNRLNKYIEIDILFITPGGIYCIESKYVSTKLVGDTKDIMWDVYNRFGKNVVYNPFMQNLEHIRCLKQYLRVGGYSTNKIYNVIMVPDKAVIESDCDLVKNAKDWLFEIAENLYEQTEEINVERVFKILEYYEVI